MNNLTKENFWNALYEKYPEGMKVFSLWIDEYKKRHEMFKDKKIEPPVNGFSPVIIKAPKYHDLPLAMQVGVFLEFIKSHEVIMVTIPVHNYSTEQMRNIIEECIGLIHSEKAEGK